ncbi:MAG: hypothetical protein ACRD21_12040 [Vicinamibacteria bacterium]
MLYGDGSPGGLLNLELKKPLPVPRYQAASAFGEQGFLRFTGDATGPLTESRRARYRVVAAAEGLDAGFSNDERRLTLFPMFSFDIGEESTLHADAELYDQRGNGYRHTVPATAEAQAGDFSALPRDLNMATNAVSPSLGVVFLARPWLSLDGTASTGFLRDFPCSHSPRRERSRTCSRPKTSSLSPTARFVSISMRTRSDPRRRRLPRS